MSLKSILKAKMHGSFPLKLTAGSWYLDRWINRLTANCQLPNVDDRITYRYNLNLKLKSRKNKNWKVVVETANILLFALAKAPKVFAHRLVLFLDSFYILSESFFDISFFIFLGSNWCNNSTLLWVCINRSRKFDALISIDLIDLITVFILVNTISFMS